MGRHVDRQDRDQTGTGSHHEAGCDYGQGYLFARPMPGDEFDALLRSQKEMA